MSLWSSQEVATAIQVDHVHNFSAHAVSIDTRSLKPGAIFVALKGEAGDGHAHVDKAFAQGAVAAIVEKNYITSSSHLLLRVDHTQTALEALGKASRARVNKNARIISVCGSVGKTGTKDLLSRLFAKLGAMHASEKSYNNHFGVPLTLANMPKETEFGVFEVGMNHPGEIVPLSAQVKPHIALITTIDKEHVEFFNNGLDGICDANAEIFTGMHADGIAVLNRDNGYFTRLVTRAGESGVKKIISFGQDAQADARLISMDLHDHYSFVKADICGRVVSFRLPIPGAHIVMNALGALAVVTAAGGDLPQVLSALEAAEAVTGRGTRHTLRLSSNKVITVIDESYNANPASMLAAFHVLSLAKTTGAGRRIAVLGDMLELGTQSPAFHADLSMSLNQLPIDLVYCCGPLMKNLYERLPKDKQGGYAMDSASLSPIVADHITDGDVLLFKGSKGSKMGVIIEHLLQLEKTKHAL